VPVLSNARHERFAQELAKGATADEAYQLAGYSANRGNASTLKAKQIIADRVEEILGAIADRVVIDEAYVLSTIKDTVERCRQAEPVRDRKGEIVLTETPDGSVAPAYVFNSNSVLRGAELLGKHIGMFKERVEHTGKDGGPIETVDRSDRDIAKDIAFVLAKGAKAQQSVN
jgi:phage terminase small subunit